MRVWLKDKGIKSVMRRHPWVFSGAVDRVDGESEPGDVVRVVDRKGNFLAWGFYNPNSRISVRLVDWSESQVIDEKWWETIITRSVERRIELRNRSDLSAFRLVFSEADFIPGLIADWYNGYIALQALTPAVEKKKEFAAGILMKLMDGRGVYDRSDPEALSLEGMKHKNGLIAGSMPPESVEVKEGGYSFLVDIAGGQKTGFFTDQRANRSIAARFAKDRDVLDCFAHTFAFSVYAAGAGASSVVTVESSSSASEMGRANLSLNGFSEIPGETYVADAFKQLREFRDRGRFFDVVILDPPKLAPTKSQVSRASRAYKDINLLAFKLLRPGGVLVTFSCSGGVDQNLFRKIIFGACLDAGREAQVISLLGQGSDHPIRLSFPESEYLKGVVCRVL